VIRGFWHAHFGWMINRDRTNPVRSPRTSWPTPTSSGSTGSSRLDHGQLAAPALLGGLLSWSWWGAATAFLLGRARSASESAAPRLVVDQLALPHGGHQAVDPARPLHELLAAGDRVDGRVVAQTCTTPIPRAPATVSAAASSTPPPASIAILERIGWVRDVHWPSPQRLERLATARDHQQTRMP
jgi:stearoyl-CoA desaturase (delta-9 desaturase)